MINLDYYQLQLKQSQFYLHLQLKKMWSLSSPLSDWNRKKKAFLVRKKMIKKNFISQKIERWKMVRDENRKWGWKRRNVFKIAWKRRWQRPGSHDSIGGFIDVRTAFASRITSWDRNPNFLSSLFITIEKPFLLSVYRLFIGCIKKR